MAKARAICTCTHCGATFEVEAVKGNRRDADSWEAWAVEHYDTCPACELSIRREAAAETAKKAAEEGLPQLTGSEKQVMWALSLREAKLEEVSQYVAKTKFKPEDMEIVNACAALVAQQTKASWWIDNRRTSPLRLLNDMYPTAKEQLEENKPEATAAKAEATMMPEEVSHATVSVVVAEDAVTAKTPKDEDFRQIVKSLGFFWDADSTSWRKDISAFTGSATERAAELINHLLRAGFPVECFDEDARKRAVSADFAPECKRWITKIASGPHCGMLAIDIPSEDRQKLYDAARAISPKAIYRNGSVLVPVHLCDLVEDFASLYGYQLSKKTKETIAEYRNQLANAERVAPAVPEAPVQQDKLQEILSSDSSVLPDLADE